MVNKILFGVLVLLLLTPAVFALKGNATVTERLDGYVGSTIAFLKNKVPSELTPLAGLVLPMTFVLNITDKGKTYYATIEKDFGVTISIAAVSYDLQLQMNNAALEDIANITTFSIQAIKEKLNKHDITVDSVSAKAEFFLTQVQELFGISLKVVRNVLTTIVYGISWVIAKVVGFFNSIFHFIPGI